jgi:hypothetical protein
MCGWAHACIILSACMNVQLGTCMHILSACADAQLWRIGHSTARRTRIATLTRLRDAIRSLAKWMGGSNASTRHAALRTYTNTPTIYMNKSILLECCWYQFMMLSLSVCRTKNTACPESSRQGPCTMPLFACLCAICRSSHAHVPYAGIACAFQKCLFLLFYLPACLSVFFLFSSKNVIFCM